jgi:Xaa-Pro aminopeptidase
VASPAHREAYRRAREFIDNAIAEVRPGATSADIVRHFPAAEEFGYGSEEEAFGLQYCHGIGLGLWESPLMSRFHFVRASSRAPVGPSSAARIEEEIVVRQGNAC